MKKNKWKRKLKRNDFQDIARLMKTDQFKHPALKMFNSTPIDVLK